MPELPFGRGYRTGPDARVNQSESWASRSREIPRRDEWSTSPFRAYGSDQTASTNYGQSLRIIMLPRLDGILEADYGRQRVTPSNAGSFVKACIYRLDTKHDVKKFIKVPSTDISFLGDSTGVKTVKLSNTAVLYPDARYFLGAWVSNTQIGLSTGANTATRVVPLKLKTISVASASAALPNQVEVSSMSNSYSAYVPWITFISALAQDVLS